MKFKRLAAEYMERLEQYVPVVERVHGPTHPEFYGVRRVFDQLSSKLKAAGAEQAELSHEFQQLREITSNYRIPEDVCETYQAVYEMLAELDGAYSE